MGQAQKAWPALWLRLEARAAQTPDSQVALSLGMRRSVSRTGGRLGCPRASCSLECNVVEMKCSSPGRDTLLFLAIFKKFVDLKFTGFTPHGDSQAKVEAVLSRDSVRRSKQWRRAGRSGKSFLLSTCGDCVLCSYFFLKKPLCKKQILILTGIISKNYEDDSEF